MYHDFDYVGFDKLRKRTPDQPKKNVKPFKAVYQNPKKRSVVGSGSSPKFRVQNKDNQDSSKFKSIGLSARQVEHRNHQMDKTPRQTAAASRVANEGQNVLPEIVKKGPINNKRDQKNIIGLSLQRNNLQPAPILIRDIDTLDQRGRRQIRSKKRSIENPAGLKNTRSRQLLLLQNQKNAAAQLFLPRNRDNNSTNRPPVRQFRLPANDILGSPELKSLSLPKEARSARGSGTKSRSRSKPIINQPAWIPSGNPNSIGRNKLASIARPLNLEY